MNKQEKDKAWIEGLIKDFIMNSPYNSLQNEKGDKAWNEPLVGFSVGSDPLYDEFKNHIGDFYWKPLEIFAQTFPEIKASAAELSVISWILPHNPETKSDHQREKSYPSERWVRARIFGEKVEVKLREHLVSSLQEKGYNAVAPHLSPFKKAGLSELYGRASTWSERHAAFASGLGTFGLCDGLITPVGKAMRCGSIVAQIEIPPTEKPYQDHHAYCLFYAGVNCRKCIERCPAEAISERGHDKEKCSNYERTVTADYIKSNFGFDSHACGLCQTAVPCESGIPTES